MTKTKQQIQEEIAELQKQLEEMEKPKEYWYLGNINGLTSETTIKNLFTLEGYRGTSKIFVQPHGLGKFETKEYAEHARAALIGLLRILKQLDGAEQADASQYNIYLYLRKYGQETIKAIKEGTYE